MSGGFLELSWFSKTAIFAHETWLLAKVLLHTIIHVHSFYLRRSKLSLFLLYRQRFLRYGPISKIALLAWNLATGKISRSCTYNIFLPNGVEIELLFALRAAVSKIQANYKIAIFEHETCQLAKIPKVAHTFSFYPKGSKLMLFSLPWDMGRFSYCHICAWNLAIDKSSKSCTCTLFLPQGVKIELIYALCAWDAGFFSKLPYLGTKLGYWQHFKKLNIQCTGISTPRHRNWAYFCSTVKRFRGIQYHYRDWWVWFSYSNCQPENDRDTTESATLDYSPHTFEMTHHKVMRILWGVHGFIETDGNWPPHCLSVQHTFATFWPLQCVQDII